MFYTSRHDLHAQAPTACATSNLEKIMYLRNYSETITSFSVRNNESKGTSCSAGISSVFAWHFLTSNILKIQQNVICFSVCTFGLADAITNLPLAPPS